MITIFTPTYNRQELLSRVYNSLCEQTNKNFEWIIVDDCSNDNTEGYISTLTNNKFNIRFYKLKNNSGKHVAYNLAIDKACGDYFLCLDSDDYLKSNAIEIIEEYVLDSKGIGVIFPQIQNNKIDNSGWNKIDKKYIDVLDTNILYGIRETAIVIKTNILKKYHFPVFESNGIKEKFCPESVLYNRLVKEGKFLAVNKGFYVSEYQESGLSSKIRQTWLKNPKSVIEDLYLKYAVLSKYNIVNQIVRKLTCILELNAFCFKKKVNIFLVTPSTILSILFFLPGIIFSYYRYKEE